MGVLHPGGSGTARALRRTDAALTAHVPAIIARLARYEIDDVVRAAAGAYPDPELRSLDAIHLATAATIFGDLLTGFVAYDHRLLAAAQALGLPTTSPGRPS